MSADKSGRSDCGIHFGTASTARPAGCLSGTSDKTRARRSTCNKQQMPVAAKTMAGVSAKGAYKIPPSLDHLHRRAQSIGYLIIRIRSVKQSLEVMFIAETEFQICVGSMFLGITARGKYFNLIMLGVEFSISSCIYSY